MTNPYNPLYGRNLVTFSTAGAFDPRFYGFDSYDAFTTDAHQDAQPVHGNTDTFLDVQSTYFNQDAGAPLNEDAALTQFANLGLTATDIVQTVVGPEADFPALLIDAGAGNDTVTVDQTVQKTVWVDGGDGNDTITIQPSLAFLPDATDQPGQRNDAKLPDPANGIAGAYSFGTLTASHAFTGLTIDSNRTDKPDTDWYQFSLASALAPGDMLDVVAGHDLNNLGLHADDLDQRHRRPIQFDDRQHPCRWRRSRRQGCRLLPPRGDDGTTATPSGIPTDYRLDFLLAAGADAAEPNNTAATAYPLTGIQTARPGDRADALRPATRIGTFLASGGITGRRHARPADSQRARSRGDLS